MKTWMKIAIVVAGYVLALVAGGVAGHLYNVQMAKLPYDTSGGMYAGGELMSELGPFLVVALLTTALALWFVRRHEGLWTAIAWTSLVFAGAGLLAVLMPLVTRGRPMPAPLLLFSLLGLAQLLGMPLWTLALALFAFIAPTPRTRRLLLVAIGIELVIGVCALVHWFVPLPPL